MMRLFDAVYFGFYTFYRVIWRDDTPRLLAYLLISACQSFVLITAIDFIDAWLFCTKTPNVAFYIVLAIVLACNFRYYISLQHSTRIESMKEQYGRLSHYAISLLVFLLSFSLFTIMPKYTLSLISDCLRNR